MWNLRNKTSKAGEKERERGKPRNRLNSRECTVGHQRGGEGLGETRDGDEGAHLL